jgi:hypothetical protein
LIGESFKSKMDKACRLLSRFELFHKIRVPRQLFAVSYYVKERSYIRGACVYKQGDSPHEGIFLVKEGEVEFRWRKNEQTTDALMISREVVMSVAGEGEAIGVEEVVDGRY